MNGASCPMCGWGLRWLPEQRAWGCDRCRQVIAAGGPPPGRSSKGLAIGIGAGVVAAAGAVVAIVIATGGGGGGGHGSREDLVKSALAAMGAGDVERLVKLGDPIELHARALDCSEREQDRQGKDRDKDKDKDKDDEDPDRDRDTGEADDSDDPQIQEKRLRRQHEKLVEKTRGMKIELVSIAGKGDEDGGDKDGDGKDVMMKKGDKATRGCVFKVDVALHALTAKVRVTEPDAEAPTEREVELAAVEAGGSWYLMAPPKLAAGGGSIGAKLRKLRDRMCACKDAECAEAVQREAKAWGKTVRAEAKALPEDERVALDEIDDEIKACRRKIADGDAAGEMKQVIAKLGRFRAMMCACADRACGEKVQQELVDWSASIADKDARPSDEDAKQAAGIMKAFGECYTRLVSGGTAPRAPDDPPPPDDPPADPPAERDQPGGTELASIPSCEEYRRLIDRVRACPKYPPTMADGIRRTYAQLEQSWASMRSSPGTRDAMSKTCAAAVESLKKSLAMICP